MLKKLTKTTFTPAILVSSIAVLLCFFAIEQRIDLIRTIVLLIFMNIISTMNYYYDIIPDKINLLLGATGVVFNIVTNMVSVLSMIGGLLLGGGSLYVIAVIYELLTKREGLGGGVIKYNGALGLWLGVQGIVLTTACAALLGLLYGVLILPLYRIIKSRSHIHSVPADGFFSIGAFLTMLYGNSIISWIFNSTSK